MDGYDITRDHGNAYMPPPDYDAPPGGLLRAPPPPARPSPEKAPAHPRGWPARGRNPCPVGGCDGCCSAGVREGFAGSRGPSRRGFAGGVPAQLLVLVILVAICVGLFGGVVGALAVLTARAGGSAALVPSA